MGNKINLVLTARILSLIGFSLSVIWFESVFCCGGWFTALAYSIALED